MHALSVSWHTTYLNFFSSALYTLAKKLLKVQILRFLSAPVKFTKLLISLLRPHFIFPSKLASIFCRIIRYNYLFCTFLTEKLDTLIKRGPLKCKFWDFWVLGQNSSIFSYHFPNAIQFFFKFCIILQCYDNSPVLFWLKHNVLLTKLAHQSVKFPDLLLLTLKFPKFILGTKGQFFLKICIILRVMRHNSSVLSSKTLYSLWKRSPTKWKFSYFHLLTLKSTKFLILTFKLRVFFPLYFALSCSIMTHNSSFLA